MAGRSWVFILQLHTNAIGLLDHVPVGDDVALGIHNHAGTERALADGARFPALTTLAAEELVKEILERGVFIAVALILLVLIGTHGAPAVRVLDGRLG